MTRRTGHDTLADLRDAPNQLRLLADWHDARDDLKSPDLSEIHHEVQDDLRRWADAIQEFLDYPIAGGYLLLAAVTAVGFFAGVVTMMAATR